MEKEEKFWKKERKKRKKVRKRKRGKKKGKSVLILFLKFALKWWWTLSSIHNTITNEFMHPTIKTLFTHLSLFSFLSFSLSHFFSFLSFLLSKLLFLFLTLTPFIFCIPSFYLHFISFYALSSPPPGEGRAKQIAHDSCKYPSLHLLYILIHLNINK